MRGKEGSVGGEAASRNGELDDRSATDGHGPPRPAIRTHNIRRSPGGPIGQRVEHAALHYPHVGQRRCGNERRLSVPAGMTSDAPRRFMVE